MRKAKPIEVLEDSRNELGTAAAGIEVLDPQQEPPAARSRKRMAKRRRIGVTQMEPS